MIEIMKNIITNVLIALYQPFGFAVILAVLFMFLYLMARERGWKTVIQWWFDEFKTNSTFRRVFFLVFYTAMILFKTLLNRHMWMNPVSNVIGIWGLYDENGNLTTETIENMALFIPFTILFLWSFKDKNGEKTRNFIDSLCRSIIVTFLFSMTIEFTQLFLHLGTFQLSDLFYNTLGGLIGGLLYWIGYKIIHKNK